MKAKITSRSKTHASTPFDDSATTRLERMGIIDSDGNLNNSTITTLAGIFAGLFYDDLREYTGDTRTLQNIYEMFKELYRNKDYQRMYLFLAIQHDRIIKPLPDPVWWIAGHSEVITAFMILFFKRYDNITKSDGGNVSGEDSNS